MHSTEKSSTTVGPTGISKSHKTYSATKNYSKKEDDSKSHQKHKSPNVEKLSILFKLESFLVVVVLVLIGSL